ncbi:MAG: J domain-containing protein [Candidatus Sericytochromatia bacterium]
MIDVDDDNIWRVNLFEILGVADNAGKDELKQVYKQLAKQNHPDRFPAGSPEQEEAKQKFSSISRAYDILTNESKRQQYLDTRRLLSHHLDEAQTAPAAAAAAATAPAAPAAASASPAARSGPAKKSELREDYKQKEAEDAFKEGQSLFNKSDLDGAITAFQRAITVMPEVGRYHSNLGRAYLMKGWKSMAQVSFKQALVLNPNDPLAKQHYEPEKPKKKGLLGGLMGKFKKG